MTLDPCASMASFNFDEDRNAGCEQKPWFGQLEAAAGGCAVLGGRLGFFRLDALTRPVQCATTSKLAIITAWIRAGREEATIRGTLGPLPWMDAAHCGLAARCPAGGCWVRAVPCMPPCMPTRGPHIEPSVSPMTIFQLPSVLHGAVSCTRSRRHPWRRPPPCLSMIRCFRHGTLLAEVWCCCGEDLIAAPPSPPVRTLDSP